jgi:2-iminobutanoate/2-iminopropanoate deaminase
MALMRHRRSSLIRCLRPDGDILYLRHALDPKNEPIVILHLPRLFMSLLLFAHKSLLLKTTRQFPPDSLTSPFKGATLRRTFMAIKSIIKPKNSPAVVGPYNHAVRLGDLLFCAGQIPIEPATGNLVSGDIQAQTERVLQNIRAILDDQGLTFAHVVKSTVFMTNLGDFAAMNEVYAKFFTADFPARSTVQVAALPKGAAVEIEVIAHY